MSKNLKAPESCHYSLNVVENGKIKASGSGRYSRKFTKAALYAACEEKNPDSACIRVPRSLDGRMQILNRKGKRYADGGLIVP